MRLAFLVLLVVSFNAYSNDCNGHLKFAVQDNEGDVDLTQCKDGYAVGYSFFYKAPIWVSYKLTEASVTPDNGRGGDPFAEDEFIPVEARSTLSDYKYSGWDRGHMEPRAAMDSTPELRDESFLMSKMTPQHPQLNQRGWKELEGYVRRLAIEFDEIYVVTGGLFKGVNRTIGKGYISLVMFIKQSTFPPKIRYSLSSYPTSHLILTTWRTHKKPLTMLKIEVGYSFLMRDPMRSRIKLRKLRLITVLT